MAQIKTKARALDMLGRQQIAGIPTALSELFKNAHDAYADNVEVDYIRKKNLLILRDDGLGMTREEFEERWLTIGTDSKLIDEDSINMPDIDETKTTRPIMGEKGIGRLAIASIGPQVLVITRSQKNGINGNIVAAFVNWTLFSLPKLNLEDINIPITELSFGEKLEKKHIDMLLEEALKNILSLDGKISQKKLETIAKQLNHFSFDPEFWDKTLNSLDSNLGLERPHLSLTGDNGGTHFIITPVDDVLSDDIANINTARRTDQSSRLEKSLLGFTNTMYENSHPPIMARFRDHTLNGECIDRISESVFFTPEEFAIADHHFNGHFNEFGQFSGIVRIYGENKEVVIPWPEGGNKETLCGPFKINLAYVHGLQKDSKVPPEDWKALRDKTDKIGGLYVYRDGIRILPYGDSDVDFLRIEQRRSKSASEYFFSYRRMFGAVELTKEYNSDLKEKAGREGFIENKSYKQFKAILENYFIQLAADFFNDKGDRSATFIETRARQQRENELIKKREGYKTAKRKRFIDSLTYFFKKLDSGDWHLAIKELNDKAEMIFSTFDASKLSIDDLAFDIERIRIDAYNKLLENMDISRPAGIGLNKELSDQWDLYQSRSLDLKKQIETNKNNIGQKLIEYEDRYGDRTGLRHRFNDSLSLLEESQRKQLNDAYSKANKILDELQAQARQLLKKNKEQARQNAASVFNDFNSTSFQGITTEELFNLKTDLESRIDSSSKIILDNINILIERLQTAKEGTDQNTTASTELVSILETEYELLREQHDKNLQLAQLGMSLGVLGHEFNNNILSIRRGLNEMLPFAARNERFKNIYERVRTGFDHLDGYLKSLMPLARRMGRRRISITGKAISEFLISVFEERMIKEEVKFTFTENFFNQSVVSFTSTLYPVFINIIDNALHWLAKSSGEKLITLDASDTGFIIKDSGPGIPTIDQHNVFEFGFSRRLGGQGMGLYIARQTLEQDGFEIYLDPYDPNSGAVFRIEKAQDDKNDTE
ncbi:ATP-binding protein [Citrobacter freundii]|uniref:ATP-binding protein n=1 Tax=Citrobacter freundii TaxID=546 RepID=UPI0018FF3FF7|nr:ATP-binding protein [Citrobacter freundii]MBJ8982782.1 sensor histidine kinase [Citrobacter freundii]